MPSQDFPGSLLYKHLASNNTSKAASVGIHKSVNRPANAVINKSIIRTIASDKSPTRAVSPRRLQQKEIAKRLFEQATARKFDGQLELDMNTTSEGELPEESSFEAEMARVQEKLAELTFA